METVGKIAQICSYAMSIFALLALLIKPMRLWLCGMNEVRNGQKCLLRADMLRMYYRHCDAGTIRQYEYENFMYEYKAYKALGGNSFIDRIYAEVKTWHIET